jgi:histidine phosphotransferase ChpT
MNALIEFRILELLNARLCHELVSPVGAINNGVELLDEDDPEFVKDAIQLIGQSARKAGQRLQFYRFAYGSSAAAGGNAVGAGKALADGLLEGSKLRGEWTQEACALSNEWQRLACNMLVLATETLPRGGTVSVRSAASGGVEIVASGDAVGVSPELRAALDIAAPAAALTSRTVHAYFTARLAALLEAVLSFAEIGEQRLVLRATPR